MSRTFPTIHRPRPDQITKHADELLDQRIANLSLSDIEEGLTQGTSLHSLRFSEAFKFAVNKRDEAEIGRFVLLLLREYYKEQAEADAEDWADRIEEIESETYDARVLRRIGGAA